MSSLQNKTIEANREKVREINVTTNLNVVTLCKCYMNHWTNFII